MKKILVVDDDPDILEAVQLILSSEGYDAYTSPKGEDTYKNVADYKPDLILLDVLLSGIDGRTISKKLKSSILTKDIPVIMISAHPGAKASIQQYGADSFVTKPFTVQELMYEITKYIGKAD